MLYLGNQYFYSANSFTCCVIIVISDPFGGDGGGIVPDHVKFSTYFVVCRSRYLKGFSFFFSLCIFLRLLYFLMLRVFICRFLWKDAILRGKISHFSKFKEMRYYLISGKIENMKETLQIINSKGISRCITALYNYNLS